LKLPDPNEKTQVIFNNTGSFHASKEDGKGSWFANAEKIVQRLKRDFGDTTDKRVLIVDRCSIHKEEGVIEYLKKHNIHLVYLYPNLTHLVQISDDHDLHGKLEKHFRAHTNSEMRETDLCTVQGIPHVINMVGSVFTMANIVPVAERKGFVFNRKRDMVTITDDSIHRFVESLENKGLLHSEKGTCDRSQQHDLRTQYFINQKRLKDAGVIGEEDYLPSFSEGRFYALFNQYDQKDPENPNKPFFRKRTYGATAFKKGYSKHEKVMIGDAEKEEGDNEEEKLRLDAIHAAAEKKRKVDQIVEERKAHIKRLNPDISEKLWSALRLNYKLSKYYHNPIQKDEDARRIVASTLAKVDKKVIEEANQKRDA
jgi:hypothetical protein